MVRAETLGKNYLDKLEKKLRAVVPECWVNIYIIEHANNLRVAVENLKGEELPSEEIGRVSSEYLNKESHSDFQSPGRSIYFFYYGRNMMVRG